jgi:enoyl-CoA hydratase
VHFFSQVCEALCEQRDRATQCQNNLIDIQLLGHVAHIKLNRPEKRNAMNWDFWRDLPRIIGDIDRDSSARCIVLSSTGPIFSAGLDLSLFGQEVFSSSSRAKKNEKELQTPQNFMSFLSFLQDSISSLQKARIPVVCAIQGGCIGGGVDLICSADIRLATNDAFFSIRETKIGMVADVGTFPRIVKLLPEGIVKELAFTGRNFSAPQTQSYSQLARELDLLERLPRMVFDVETGAGVRYIEFRDHDDLTMLAVNFCKEHGLEEDLVEPLARHMEEKLKEQDILTD